MLDRMTHIGKPIAYSGLALDILISARPPIRGVALGQAMRLAENLGAKPLINEIKRLAVIGRVHIFTPARPPSPPATTHGLSPRELEIVSCLIEGNTNKQISQRLFISERTVGVHVGNILNKLGVRNRTEAATIGLRLGLDT